MYRTNISRESEERELDESVVAHKVFLLLGTFIIVLCMYYVLGISYMYYILHNTVQLQESKGIVVCCVTTFDVYFL